MRKYKYVIIDDDDMDRLAIGFYLKNYTFLEHGASFSSSREGLDYILNNKTDIVFLDIDMPDISGIDIQKQIKDNVLCTVFVTSHPEFAVEGFNLEVLDYIVKPLTQERFDHSTSRIKEYLDTTVKAGLFDISFKDESVLIKEGYDYVSIRIFEIIYMEALKDYTKLVLLDKRTITVHNNLGKMLKDEYFKHFIRIHKSFAIQKNYIQKIRSNDIVLANNITLPIGLSYKKEVFSLLS